jgi:hypothetical protein
MHRRLVVYKAKGRGGTMPSRIVLPEVRDFATKRMLSLQAHSENNTFV